jgi:polyhydroxyalkanoate synthesis regulator phasin
MTKAKVIEFQKANKDAEGKDLVPDGKVGDKTYSVMAYKKITTTTDTQKTAADAITNKTATDSTQTATDSTAVKVNETGEVDENLGKLVGTAVKKGAQYVDDVIKYFKKPAQKGAFPVKQGVQKASDVYVPKSAQPAMRNLLQKYGSQRWTPALNTALQPARQEIAIVANDLKRLQAQLPYKTTDTVTKEKVYSISYHLKNITDSNILGCLRFDKGNPFDFNASIGLVDNVIDDVDALILSKRLSPENTRILQFMKENLNDASIKIQSGLTDLLTTK